MLFFLKKMVFRWAVENIVGQRIEKEVRAAWKTHKAKKQAEKQGTSRNPKHKCTIAGIKRGTAPENLPRYKPSLCER